ncbi:beta-class carbonic anhydrase [Ferviditalea candida]|uniref:carbonic anhydrase n=1 Tax=Ferviditalea candida TaxID=3108399 RepID=A0ABU5ZHG4_9BACL|nr:carbonic anhydrase [Paenibacillaceae bacterium T2]
MSLISEIMAHNAAFVENKEYESFRTSKFPDKKMVILACMDTRLVELLPKAMNLKNGDAKIIKNAGAIVSHPFGSIMRSILVAVYEMNAKEAIVVGHHDCGMAALRYDQILEKMRTRGITEDVLNTLSNSGIQLKPWLTGFDTVREGVENSVRMIKNHPLLPKDVVVHGLIIHPETGKLEIVVDGYSMSGR